MVCVCVCLMEGGGKGGICSHTQRTIVPYLNVVYAAVFVLSSVCVCVCVSRLLDGRSLGIVGQSRLR